MHSINRQPGNEALNYYLRALEARKMVCSCTLPDPVGDRSGRRFKDTKVGCVDVFVGLVSVNVNFRSLESGTSFRRYCGISPL